MKKNDLTDEMDRLSGELLTEGYQISYKTRGLSMYPTLRPGDVAVLEKCSIEDYKCGDVVVFRQNEQMIGHRIVSIDKGEDETLFYTKGDNSVAIDKAFTPDKLIGKINIFQRKYKTHKVRKTNCLFRLCPQTCLKYNRLHYLTLKAFQAISSNFSSLKHNFPLILVNSGKLFTLQAFISILQGIVPFATIVLIKLLIDRLTNGSFANSHFYNSFEFLLSVTAFAFILTAVLAELKTYYSEKMSQSVSKHIYQILHKRHNELSLAYYENPETQDKLHRAVQEASFRPLKIINTVLNGVKSIVSAVVLLLLFISIRWYLILILVVAVLPGIFLRLYFSQKHYRLKESQSTREREMYYYNRILTAFPFAKEIKIFGFAAYFQKIFSTTQAGLFAEKINLGRKEMRWGILSQVFSVLLIFASLAAVATLHARGSISIGTVVLFFFAFQRGYAVLNEFFRAFTQIAEDNIFLKDFVAFLQDKNLDNKAEKQLDFSLKQGISIRNMSFGYGTSLRNALQNINLDIEAGKTTALVGANGSGKTTLIKLLCGFYHPTRGQILFDGKDATQMGQEEICKHISAVFQDFALYNIPAIENLFLGDISKNFDEEKAREAAKAAGVDEVLSHLPQGYRTMLGTLFKGGEELSIGQWQKIAIARAIYRDAPLLLLDEPSSALDATSEQQILEKLRTFSRGRTAIIVSHRLSSVKWADIIYVLDKGEVVEQGTHESLLERKGKYFELYQAAVNV